MRRSSVPFRSLAVLATLPAWLFGAGLPAGCAPGAFNPCNSDNDCLRRELCVDGYCGLAGEDAPAASRPAELGRAVHGELTIDLREPRTPEEPTPDPEPPPPEPAPEPGLPGDWADPGLLHRAIITIQGVPGVQETSVVDLPVLVELNAADLGAAFLAGARERVLFTTSDNVPLAADLDADRGDQMFFWVKLTFDARAALAAPERFFVYVGGDSALVAPSAPQVWSSFYGVYHMGAPRDVLQPDATGVRAAENEGAEAETVPCSVGACVFFDGADDRLVVPSPFPELAGATAATISATVRLVAVNDAFIAVWSTPDHNRSRFFLGTDGNGVPQAAVRTSDGSPALHVAEGGPALVPGVEYRLDAVLDMVAGTIALFVDGQHRATDTFATSGALPATVSAEAAIGAASGAAAIYELDGRVDEVRISARPRTADYLKVDAASRAGQLTVVTLDR